MRFFLTWHKKLIIGLAVIVVMVLSVLTIRTLINKEEPKQVIPMPDSMVLKDNTTGEEKIYAIGDEGYHVLYKLVDECWWLMESGKSMGKGIVHILSLWEEPQLQLEFVYPEMVFIPGLSKTPDTIVFSMDADEAVCTFLLGGEYLDPKAFVFECSDELRTAFADCLSGEYAEYGIAPTGYPSGEIQWNYVMINGRVYQNSGTTEVKKEGFDYNILTTTKLTTQMPYENWQGTQLEVGSKFYYSKEDTSLVYKDIGKSTYRVYEELTYELYEHYYGSEFLEHIKYLDGIKTSSYTEFNKLEGAAMEITELSMEDMSLTVKISYEGKEEIMAGEHFAIEQYRDGEWYVLPFVSENIGFVDIGYPLEKGDSREIEHGWKWCYGELPAGQYRIIKDVTVGRGENLEKYYLMEEFAIQ